MAIDAQRIAEFCRGLPGAREDVKWGDYRVFSVAGNKMFATLGRHDRRLAFKVDADLFLGYCDRPGLRPAPYLARAHWIAMDWPPPLAEGELRSLLTRSHQLVVARLPKRRRVGLLLD